MSKLPDPKADRGAFLRALIDRFGAEARVVEVINATAATNTASHVDPTVRGRAEGAA